jgi:phosphate/sulfate permease
MELDALLKFGVLIIGFYMAWNIGANDVSNAMGTSVGSGALTMRRAVIIAAILEFCGAFFLGGNVSETMQSGLIDTQLFAADPLILVIGMCGALLGTGIWLQLASYFGLPVSTTHAIVGSIVGFGALAAGFGAVQWGEVGSVAVSWVVSPLLSGIFAYFLFNALQRKILFAMNPTAATRKFLPLLVFCVFFTFTLSLIFNGLSRIDLTLTFAEATGISLCFALIAALITYTIISRIPLPKLAQTTTSLALPQNLISLEKAIKHLRRVRAISPDETRTKISGLLDEMHLMAENMRRKTHYTERTSEYHQVEKWFIPLQIISACFIAFAHGANDVANAIGPMAAVLDTLKNGVITGSAPVPSWLLAFGGLGIVIGLATWGWRVIQTIGKKITQLTPTRGFCAEFGAAITILFASKLGLPISTTHCLVGAVLGVGLARGLRALNLSMVKDIVLSWIITLPASALISIICFYLLRLMLPSS